MEANRKITSEPSAADRVNDALHNGQNGDAKPSTGDDVAASQNVLKIADGVEEDTCQVVPVEEIEGDKMTDAKDKGSSEVRNDFSFAHLFRGQLTTPLLVLKSWYL